MARYMRDQFTFYGISAPVLRSIVRPVLRDAAPLAEADAVAVASLCWSRLEREWQYVACDVLSAGASRWSADVLPVVEGLIVTKSWWDTVDGLAAHTVGGLVASHPTLVAVMDQWIDDDNIWLARTALLHQLRYKQRTDADRLFGYCLRRAADREFFIRRAIGWALREYSRTDPDAVAAFVAEHAPSLSPLSRREALKRINREAQRSTAAP